jgi:hypothetical protein
MELSLRYLAEFCRQKGTDLFFAGLVLPKINLSPLFHSPSFRPHFSNGNVADSIAEGRIDQARKRKVG